MREIRQTKRIVRSDSSVKTEFGMIPYCLTRSSARRTLTITVDEHGQVGVASPYRMQERKIVDFLNEKARWIVKKIEEAQANRIILDQKDYEDGKQFLFLGTKYRLSVFERNIKRGHVSFNKHDGWFVTVPTGLSKSDRKVKVKDKMLKWYRRQAQEILGGRIFHYSRLMGIEPKKITIRTQKRLWGCCDYNTQSINLNWQIILSPLAVVDYVVVHEMCHLTIPNHSKRFWKKVEKVMPDFRHYKKWLGDNHLDMALP